MITAISSSLKGEKSKMATRYRETFMFFDTEAQAKAFCDNENLNPYIRKHHAAGYTPWSSHDGTENKYIAWYVTK
jgi:hypothetical protein